MISTKLKVNKIKKTAAHLQPATAPRAARLPPDQRRMQLLGCAMKVFAEHGLGAANHGLTAAEAKVSVPTIFFYFPSREVLVDSVLREIENLYRTTYERITALNEPAHETLLHLSQAMTQLQDTHPYHSQVWLEWSVAARSELWPRYLKTHRHMIKALTKLIERGQKEGHCRPDLIAQDEAQILHGASYAIAQMKLTGARPSRIARLMHSMVQTVLTDTSLLNTVVIPPTKPASRRRSA
jgi:TetR/AcrR family hemagglutinin/protease transcriptional regulator